MAAYDFSGQGASDERREDHPRGDVACREGTVGAQALAVYGAVGLETCRTGTGERDLPSAVFACNDAPLFPHTQRAGANGCEGDAYANRGAEVFGQDGS